MYGPIQSRRLGNSLGINILPLSWKSCDFHCVYCQYGDTPEAAGVEKLKRITQLKPVLEGEIHAMATSHIAVDCLTLAGNGEPTLHPDFPEIVEAVRALRDRFYPKARTGILTNGSRLYLPRIRQAMLRLDERYVKLDAGTLGTLRKINRPRGELSWNKLVEGVRNLENKTIQSLFVTGKYDNTDDDDIGKWIALLRFVRPQAVHVYSIDRGTAEVGVKKVGAERLGEIARRLESETGIKALVFG